MRMRRGRCRGYAARASRERLKSRLRLHTVRLRGHHGTSRKPRPASRRNGAFRLIGYRSTAATEGRRRASCVAGRPSCRSRARRRPFWPRCGCDPSRPPRRRVERIEYDARHRHVRIERLPVQPFAPLLHFDGRQVMSARAPELWDAGRRKSEPAARCELDEHRVSIRVVVRINGAGLGPLPERALRTRGGKQVLLWYRHRTILLSVNSKTHLLGLQALWAPGSVDAPRRRVYLRRAFQPRPEPEKS
jgi:hypothetical protein